MALLDKLNNLAATASSKANTAIGTGKLNLKINGEEKKITEFTLNIGELILDKLDAGETFDDEIMALYDSILAGRTAIDEARAEIEAIRQAAAPTCANCGCPLTDDAKYCANCGAKVEKEEEPVCANPDCGAELEPNANFCDQCGTLVEAVAPVQENNCACGEEKG